MSDIFDFIQSNWYELGSLAFQFAILAVAVWYGRKALRILTAPLVASSVASRAQVELLQDLEKLSATHVSRPVAQPETYASRPVAMPEAQQVLRPVAMPEAVAPAYGGVGRMLSPRPATPAESYAEAMVESHAEVAARPRREGPSPWKAVVTWLNTPWGSPAGLSRRQAS